MLFRIIFIESYFLYVITKYSYVTKFWNFAFDTPYKIKQIRARGQSTLITEFFTKLHET